MNKVYSFKITISNNVDSYYESTSGFLMASSYTDAVNQLEAHYQTDLCGITSIQRYEDAFIQMPESIIKDYQEHTLAVSYPCDQYGNSISEPIDWNVQETEFEEGANI